MKHFLVRVTHKFELEKILFYNVNKSMTFVVGENDQIIDAENQLIWFNKRKKSSFEFISSTLDTHSFIRAKNS